MIPRRPYLPALAVLVLAGGLTGCLTQRTISSGGQTTEQKIIVKRPVQGLINNTRRAN